MSAFNRSRAAAVALGIIGVQALGARWAFQAAVIPTAPELVSWGASAGEWRCVRELPMQSSTLAELHANRVLDRVYQRPGSGIPVELFVAWFQAQRGAAQPHSPQVCLPGSGWIPIENSTLTIATSAGMLPLNVYTVTKRGATAQILYWYQSPRRVVASEWAAKIFTVWDGVRDGRTDTAVVRVAVAGGSRSAAEEARAFARAVYPELRARLPR